MKHYQYDYIYGVGSRDLNNGGVDVKAVWFGINDLGVVLWSNSWGYPGLYAYADKATIDPLASELIYMTVKSNFDAQTGFFYPRMWIISIRTSDGRI